MLQWQRGLSKSLAFYRRLPVPVVLEYPSLLKLTGPVWTRPCLHASLSARLGDLSTEWEVQKDHHTQVGTLSAHSNSRDIYYSVPAYVAKLVGTQLPT